MATLGKFIVIDGTDGSGKTTQYDILIKRLEENGYPIFRIKLPQYQQKSAGLVEEYLDGKYGFASEVGPYVASIFYACDRYDASFKIKQALRENKIVIADRYVTANMGHQGGKINNDKERQKFFSWLDNLEYEIFKIPRPDLNIILHVDPKIGQTLMSDRGNKLDIHEIDLEHLHLAEKVYLQLADIMPNTKKIECVRNEQIMTREEISDLIWQEVMNILKQPTEEHHKIIDKQKDNQLKVQLLTPTAKLPTRSHHNDAGLDFYADQNIILQPGQHKDINTSVKIAIPEGHVGLIWDKSGLAMQGLHVMGGVIDSGYRGEIIIELINLSGQPYIIEQGQKIAQMLIQPVVLCEVEETKINDQTDRGEAKHGSTGLY